MIWDGSVLVPRSDCLMPGLLGVLDARYMEVRRQGRVADAGEVACP